MSAGANKFRRDGSYRANEGQGKLDKIRMLAGKIDGADLSRLDSMTVFAVIDLLTSVLNRQQGREQMPNDRPDRWTAATTPPRTP